MTSEVYKNNLEGVKEIVSEKTDFTGLKWSREAFQVWGSMWSNFNGKIKIICQLFIYLYRNSTGITMVHFIKPSMWLFLSYEIINTQIKITPCSFYTFQKGISKSWSCLSKIPNIVEEQGFQLWTTDFKIYVNL